MTYEPPHHPGDPRRDGTATVSAPFPWQGDYGKVAPSYNTRSIPTASQPASYSLAAQTEVTHEMSAVSVLC